jgi:glyoxylase-like metal-dependent hydrolase (beta-lactamase superfamily II)
MKREARIVLSLLFALGLGRTPRADAGELRKVLSLNPAGSASLYVWTDSCNVYVVRDEENALLIDLGDGSVLEHLSEIGVKRVEWVLFTHHHREQSQGYPRLIPWGAKVGGPEAERAFFERPSSFRKLKPTLADPFTVHGASFLRPPIQPIPLDRGFAKLDDFEWRGHALRCLETKGNSPGSMSYFLKGGNGWLAFTGDVILSGARMHNWFDSEWDYGFAAGLYALHSSAALIASFGPSLVLPSHGAIISHPKRQLDDYQVKLRHLIGLAVRGYDVFTFAGADQDRVSKPTEVPNIWQVSPHLFKFKGADFWPNFHLLLADSGHALAVDCGLLEPALLDRAIEQMRQQLGLKQIDACILTHMHGDHMLNAVHLRQKWGTQIWALDNMVEKCQHPESFDYAAMVESYEEGPDSVPIDRAFKPGESLNWEGYRLKVDWLPGQTEFALGLSGMVDGKRIVFTGDNIFGNPADPAQRGNEAVVARNSAILEEGYIHGAELLRRLQPELLLGGHSWVMDQPAHMLERYRLWAYQLRSALQSVSESDDYRYWFDPYWVRAEPYRTTLRPDQSATVSLNVRNFRAKPQKHHIEIHTPAYIQVEPSVLDGIVEAGGRRTFQIRVSPTKDAPAGMNIVALDVSLDGSRFGEWFDLVVAVVH